MLIDRFWVLENTRYLAHNFLILFHSFRSLFFFFFPPNADREIFIIRISVNLCYGYEWSRRFCLCQKMHLSNIFIIRHAVTRTRTSTVSVNFYQPPCVLFGTAKIWRAGGIFCFKYCEKQRVTRHLKISNLKTLNSNRNSAHIYTRGREKKRLL